MPPGSQRVRAPELGARVAAVFATLLALLAVALPVVGGHNYLHQVLGTPEVVVAISFSVTGALLVGSPQSCRMGWLLLAIGVFAGIYTASLSYTAFALDGATKASLPDGSWLGVVTAWLSIWTWWPAWGLVSMVLLQVVPHGRTLGGAWLIPLYVALAGIVAAALVFAVEPGPTSSFPAIDNPLGWQAPSGLLDAALRVLTPIDLGVIAIGVVSLVVRVARADGVERRQVGWVGYAAALTIALIFVIPGPFANLAVLLVPVGIAVAALRYRLFDLDLVVNRTLVAVLLLGGAAVLYVAMVAWVGELVGTSTGPVPFLAAFGIALAFHPARVRLQRWVDRLFFGRRGDPYSLLRDLDRALRDAAAPREALTAATGLLRDGLRLSGVAVAVPLPSGATVTEQAGTLAVGGATVPLLLHGETVGELRAGGRTAGPLNATDLRVLQALTGPLASVAYALRLSGDLEESRRRILEAREDERRRVRRDLHDGLGPQLAGVVMGIDVIRSTLSRGDAQRAAALAATVGDQTRTAVEDVRRLVAGLRPPVLDDLGLVGALRAITPTDGGPKVRVLVQGDLAALPAAVEVAAYRIASEAVTNAVRHSGADRIEVRLCADAGVVRVQVDDDGHGMPTKVRSGVGLVSMRERAAELGGRFTLESSPRGTSVVAELPLASS